MSAEKSIIKVGAIIQRDKKILVVRKRGVEKSEYIIPGGRVERGETNEQVLKRELAEELMINLVAHSLFGHFDDIALYEKIPILMDVYEVTYIGEPNPASEIKDYLWISRDYANLGITLGSVLAKHVIPKLMEQGKL